MNASHLAGLFDLNFSTFRKNLEGITHAESVETSQPGCNSLNWVLGHVVATRNVALGLLGADPIWGRERAALYSGAPDAGWARERAVQLDEIVSDLERSQDRLRSALFEASAETLEAPAGDRTVGEQLAVLHFHECYHGGQLGVLRRLLGKPGVIKPPGRVPRRSGRSS